MWLNNHLRLTELEIEREINRILGELTEEVGESYQTLTQNLSILASLDCINAKARLSQLLRASDVAINTEGRIALKGARHPLLLLAREEIVPNDITISQYVKVLVISGSNSGGKTVTLKAIGLFALMVRAGLHLPCDGGDMAFFPEVYADIGDEQDLVKDLSSFSAHIKNIINLLKEASPGSIVLLDELATSTDPQEGAALAEAILIKMVEKGFRVILTTHYNSLKALAQSKEGFLNASVEFDVKNLLPTYRLIFNMPGGSSALEIAARLGIEKEMLDHAVDLLRSDERKIEHLISDMQKKHINLEEDIRKAEALRSEQERLTKEQREITERLSQQEKEVKKTIRKKISHEVTQAKARIGAIMDEIKAAEKNLSQVKAAKEKLVQVEREIVCDSLQSGEYLPLEGLKAGDRVEVVSLGIEGTLLEDPQGRSEVRVKAGSNWEMSVDVSLLGGIKKEEYKESESRLERKEKLQVGEMLTSDTLDLRGRTGEDAVEETIKFLDRAFLQGIRRVHIIHGHGTGSLKATLRSYLNDSLYVDRFHPGDLHEGGDGVTVVELK